MFAVLFLYILIKKYMWGNMKRVFGFALFCIAVGIIVSFFIPNRFWEIVVIIGLMVIGYNMFTSGCKCKK